MNEEIQSNEGPDLQPQIQAVEDLIDEGNYDAALSRARGLFDDYPDRAETYTLLGDIYAARRMWPEAVEWYHEGAERGDSSAADKLRDARTQLIRQLEQPGQPRRTASASQAEQQRTKLWITLASAGAVVVIAAVIASLTLFSKPLSPATEPAVAQGTTGLRGPRQAVSSQRSAASIAQSQRRAQAEGKPQMPDSGSRSERAEISTSGLPSTTTKPEEDSTTITVRCLGCSVGA